MNWVAEDLMTTDVVCVKENMDLRELAQVFAREGIGGAPVVDEDELLRIFVGELLEQHAVDHGEDRRRGTEAEGQGQDSQAREAGIATEGLQRLSNRAHRVGPRALA